MPTHRGDPFEASDRAAPMNSPLATYRGVVYPWQCDHMGHMNVTFYVAKFDEATWVLFDHIGLTRAFLEAKQRGMAAVEQRIGYVREVHAGDVLAVETTVLEVRDKVLRFAHRMAASATGETAAVMAQTTVHLDTALRKSAVLPESVREEARGMIGVVALPWERRGG